MGRVINVGESAYGDGEIKAIPDGTKLVATVYAIEEVAVKSGDNAGKPQLDVTFKIQEDGPYKGREIRYTKIPLYDSPAAWKLVTFAQAVGWTTKPGVELPDNLQSVLGTALQIKVTEKAPDQQGRIFNDVGGYASATAAVTQAAAAPSWNTLNG